MKFLCIMSSCYLIEFIICRGWTPRSWSPPCRSWGRSLAGTSLSYSTFSSVRISHIGFQLKNTALQINSLKKGYRAFVFFERFYRYSFYLLLYFVTNNKKFNRWRCAAQGLYEHHLQQQPARGERTHLALGGMDTNRIIFITLAIFYYILWIASSCTSLFYEIIKKIVVA